MKRYLRRYSLALRVIALLMVAVTVTLTASPAFVPSADAADGPSYTKKNIYKWTRGWGAGDAPINGQDARVLLMWQSQGTYYATMGTSRQSDDKAFYGVNISDDPMIQFGSAAELPGDFYTDSDMQAWHFYGMGSSTDEDMDVYYFRRMKIALCDAKHYAYDDSNTLLWTTNSDKRTKWFFIGSGISDGGGYSDNATWGYISVLHERSGYDRYLDWGGNRLTINEFGTFVGGFDYDCPDFLYYYMNGHEEYSCISSNYTVKSGTTLQIKNNSWLDKDVTLTVEPGAVLSISGNFVNDGLIVNYGTVLLNDNASVFSFGDRSYTGGSITNYGNTTYYDANKVKMLGEGNLIVMENARLLLPYQSSTGGASSASIKFFGGSTLVNYGLVFVPGILFCSGALIQNKASGIICSHVKIKGPEYSLKGFTWNNKKNFDLEEVTGVVNDFNNGRSVIENDGYWENYTQLSFASRSEYTGSGSYT